MNHNIPLCKLIYYKIRGLLLSLLNSYLSHRFQYIYITEHSSDIKRIISEIPRGSILEQFLFNLYIHVIVNIHIVAKFVIYADDTSIFISSLNSHEIVDAVNFTLSRWATWARENGLSIYTEKTNDIFFVRRMNKVLCQGL